MSVPLSLAIVVPCYNEEEVLPETSGRIVALIHAMIASSKISEDSAVYLIDDGSRDGTWALIERLAKNESHIVGIKLSRNRGHQNALLAGLFTAEGDAIVTIDADLQDDIGAIEEMVDRHIAGADIVYGVRRHRDTDSWFKSLSARAFYRFLRSLGADSVEDHADYRLMSCRAVESLKQYQEVNMYLRGLVPLLGFRSEIVYYDRAKRFAGQSKYPLRKMVGLALEAITSFSIVPLRLVMLLGFTVLLGTMAVTGWALWVHFFTNDTVPGWTSVVVPMYFLGGVQIFCIGVLGEYLGKTYAEVKRRPRYFIEKVASWQSTHLIVDKSASRRVSLNPAKLCNR